jgi:putative transposase
VSNLKKRAEFRFAVIADLLVSPPCEGGLRQTIDLISRKPWKDPATGQPLQLSRRTIERWYYLARRTENPVEALFPKVRMGESKVISPEMLAELERSYKEFPKWTTQLHYDNFAIWVAQNKLALPSYATVRRMFRRRGWQRCKQIRMKEIRSYENPYVGGLWHLDFHHGRRLVIAPNGKKLVPICLAIMDDCSRVCSHVQWFFHEDTKVLVHGFVQGLLKRGLPRALMSDNGSAMTSYEFTQGLGRLGIKHELTLPYSPHQNGKQESFWGSVEGRLMSLLDAEPNLSLEKLNQATQAWVEMEYNHRTHSGIKMTPLEKWGVAKSVLRKSLSIGDLRKAFRREVKRRVRRSDGTFMLDGVRFEVPVQYRTLEVVTVHYPKWDLSLIDLVDPKTAAVLCPIYPLDLERNANQIREVFETTASPPAVNPKTPRLLEKYIEDYSAEGSPIAYIPLEEEI